MTDRRSLVKILAGATLLGVARRVSAQKVKSVTIAYLALLAGEDRSFVPNFLRRLDQFGYVDGQNLHFVYRCAEGRPELFKPCVRLHSDEARCACQRIWHGCRQGGQGSRRRHSGCIHGCRRSCRRRGRCKSRPVRRQRHRTVGPSRWHTGHPASVVARDRPCCLAVCRGLESGHAVRGPRLQGARGRSACREDRAPGARGTLTRGDRAAARGQQGRRSRRPCDPRGPPHLQSADRNCRGRLPPAFACYLRLPRVRGGGRPHVLTAPIMAGNGGAARRLSTSSSKARSRPTSPSSSRPSSSLSSISRRPRPRTSRCRQRS
jgi:hypothetical protein